MWGCHVTFAILVAEVIRVVSANLDSSCAGRCDVLQMLVKH